ncbi:uncharacterized protein LOC130051157 [Ostrea edulis]|uniref:uncharacterized protein LOC130051157 n=1 Tax=Ostrea edulis TaxID=37623 RepID=UPI0024AEEACF|nr:uncharacterized protein LOC130051157 [Ostrea edulis]
MRHMFTPYYHSIRDMTPVSVLGFVIITAILCRCTTARFVRRDYETIVTERHVEGYCSRRYRTCMKNVNEGDVKPVTKSDGSLYFPPDFFTRACEYFATFSGCYEKMKSTSCGPRFSRKAVKGSKIMSIKLCRNADAIDTLIHCLNDKYFYEEYMRPVEDEEGGNRCKVAKEKIRQGLRVAKYKCGETEYTNLKTVVEDFGNDFITLLYPESDDQSCIIDVNTLTPDRRRRGVASTTMKKLMDGWIL